MRARTIPVGASLPGRRLIRARLPWRALASAVRRSATSTDFAQIQARVEATRAEHERRYLDATRRRWS